MEKLDSEHWFTEVEWAGAKAAGLRRPYAQFEKDQIAKGRFEYVQVGGHRGLPDTARLPIDDKPLALQHFTLPIAHFAAPRPTHAQRVTLMAIQSRLELEQVPVHLHVTPRTHSLVPAARSSQTR